MVEVGEILEGKVTGLTNFGAFISLPGNLTGMVHISEVSQSYVSDIHEHLKENQTVKVKVIDITPEGKISLSIKKALPAQQQPQGERSFRQNKGHRNSTPNVWKGQPSFEDMMDRFKKVSDEKMTDLKRATDGKRGSYSRRK